MADLLGDGQDVTTRPTTAADRPAIDDLHEHVFGPGRFARSAYRVREGTPYVSRFCRVAVSDGKIIAAIRMTPVLVGGTPGALLLGPLAVDPAFANLGYARRLIAESLEAAVTAGLALVVLVGDVPYYGRLGFQQVRPGQITFPGPADPARILAKELVPGALATMAGMVVGDTSSGHWA